MTSTVAELGESALRRLGVAIIPAADRPALTATVTAATIANNALIELGVIAADETANPSDAALALAKAGAVHDSLTGQANVSWAADSVPQAVSEEYSKLTAAFMATSFGKSADPAIVGMLEGRVRKYALISTAPDLATDAVQGVHDDLAMRGLVRWSVFDIPTAVADQYVLLAANALAPLFGVPVNQRDDAQAMRGIAQYIALPTSGETIRAEYF